MNTTTSASKLAIFDWARASTAKREQCLQRPAIQADAALQARVRDIIEAVRRDGDVALRALTQGFDGVALDDLAVPGSELDAAESRIPTELRQAIIDAAQRIALFHQTTAPVDSPAIETAPGVRCESVLRPIERVGLYVPGGSAPLISSVLMQGIPAAMAGCRERILCTPPDRNGEVNPALLFAAKLCGLQQVFRVGGAQAIAAMALGTSSIARCDKLFGPGNAYVTAAKQQVCAMPGGPAIDLPAGPSEVLVIADAEANPQFIAADLLSQAEHGADSQVILLSDDVDLLRAVIRAIALQTMDLPRANIVRQALGYSRIIRTPDIETAVTISNRYAPEHLILALREPRSWLRRVSAAGSIFLGQWAAEALGDYCSGSNHILPTAGAARAFSGVSVASFLNRISVQTLTAAGLQRIGPCAVTLARAEGLEAHARAVERRMTAINAEGRACA